MQKLQDPRREAMNRALFVLIRQANATHQLFREFEKYPSHFEKAFNLPALKPPLYQDLIQNLADLDFLLGSPQPGLLMDLAIEQERFHQAIECLKIRNDFYITEVQPAVAKFALNGKTVTLEETASVLGERLFGGAMNGAQIAWDHISANNVTIPAIHKRLFAQAKILFPGHHFITYEKIG